MWPLADWMQQHTEGCFVLLEDEVSVRIRDENGKLPYNTAGIDNFQQSPLNTPLSNFLSLVINGDGSAEDPESMRQKATINEIEPLRTSFIRTAVAAEYILLEGVETLE